MQEYVSEAIVLTKDAHGDLDARVSLFTKKFGKLRAKVKSARKITSKLSPHLEPGNLVRTRLVERNGLQVVDALKSRALGVPGMDLEHLSYLLAEAQPDQKLWNILSAYAFEWPRILAILGWDPAETLCEKCGDATPDYFHRSSQEFFCTPCVKKFPAYSHVSEELILLRP